MRNLTREDLIHLLDKKIFHQISEVADEQGVECYVVGGYVRDLFLERPSQDIDIVTVGSGIALAKALAGRLGRGAHLSVFSNFGTAQDTLAIMDSTLRAEQEILKKLEAEKRRGHNAEYYRQRTDVFHLKQRFDELGAKVKFYLRKIEVDILERDKGFDGDTDE